MVLQIGVDSKRLQVQGGLYRASPAPDYIIGLGSIGFLFPCFDSAELKFDAYFVGIWSYDFQRLRFIARYRSWMVSRI
jgi:hypothetical protein